MDKHCKTLEIIIRSFLFLLLFAIMAKVLPKTTAFSFDSSNSCSPNGKVSRRGRAQLIATIPCDLAQGYCNLPGTAYPWHAVRRFVHENQGLMKRMYGDMRHISVLRNEIENNEIEVDDIEMAAERYSRDGYRRSAKAMHNRDDYVGDGLLRTNDVLMEPHFRPVSSTMPTPSTNTKNIENSNTDNIVASTSRSRVRITTERSKLSAVNLNNRRTNYSGNRGGLNRRRTTTTTQKPTEMTTSSTTTTTANIPLTTISNVDIDNEREINYSDDDDIRLQLNSNTADEIGETNTKRNVEEEINFESNSVYEPPTSPPSELMINGDNIQIIESPHLGGLNNVSVVSTIPSLLKMATSNKPETETTTVTVTATATTTATLTPPRRTQLNRQRPQQLHKVVASNNSLKESSNSKSQSNESERIPSTSTAAGNSNVNVNGNANTNTKTNINVNANTVKSGNADHNEADKNADAIADNNFNDNNKHKNENHKNNFNNYNMAPTEPTPSHNLQLSASASESESESASLSPSQLKSSSAPSPSSTLLPSNQNLDILTHGNVHEHPPTTTSSSTTTNPISSVTSAAAAAAAAAVGAAVATATPPVLRDGQLFQDTVKQEPVQIAPHARGVNACPVKEEVVAPFWANNTRGEVLALLNLYPFEQYVHWEKCTHEHKQMYCRDGCRCEQQYRLHRLLAYDPHNECRGIFSDWFRFPSCCICKCYNIPMEFRATSRSPRSESSARSDDWDADNYTQRRRHPIEVAEEEVKRAIYEHATEDWYRPRDEFDFYDG